VHPVPLDDDEHHQRSVSSAISNLVVRVTREHTGRGPTRARTYMQDALITVVLRETLTKARSTGRRVIAFMSDSHFDPDLAVELLLLEQRPTEDSPETGRSDPR
jgi:hypothetical protein